MHVIPKVPRIPSFPLLSLLLLMTGVLRLHATDTLHLNRGLFVSQTSDTIPALAFNSAPVYDSRNTLLLTDPSSTLELVVINNDTTSHGFAVEGITAGNVIAPGASLTLSLSVPAGVFRYWDDYLYPANAALGAAGMIVSGVTGDGAFFWNIQAFEQGWNENLAVGLPVDWAHHAPDFFTVNGKSYPQIEMDSSALITGNVGDTLMIYVANNSRICSSIHFHGYHVTVLAYSHNPIWVGRIKDTVPIRGGETMILRLVPDKPGMFPLHDHNLLSVTSKKWYPYGIRSMMEIQ